MLMAEKAGLSGISFEIWLDNPKRIAEQFVIGTDQIPKLKSRINWINQYIIEIAEGYYHDFLYIKDDSLYEHDPDKELSPCAHQEISTVKQVLEILLNR